MARYVWVVLLMIVVVAPVEIAQACSGGGPPHMSFDYVVENAEYIVRATVVAVDDFASNAVLQAEQYLTGGNGPFNFVLSQFPPETIARRNAYSYARCVSRGYLFTRGESAYFAINRAVDGSYHFTPAPEYQILQGFMPAQFPMAINLRSNPEIEGDMISQVSVEVSDEQAFIDLVEDISEQEASARYPTGDLAYPSYTIAPLLITTDQGTQYMFPVDFGDLVRLETPVTPRSDWRPSAFPNLFTLPDFCAEVDCRITTPDLSFSGTQMDEGIIEFVSETVEGQAFAFSSTSEVVVVWHDDVLDIYLISLDTTRAYDEYFPALALLTQIPLATNDAMPVSALYGLAMWSADGTTFTYGDAAGVWVFDIFRQSEPQLVVAAEDGRVPSPLFLSSNARYLAYTWDRAGTDWITIDRMTGETFENALISPNERYMAFIASPNAVVSEAQEMGCELPLSYDCRVVMVETPRYFEWIESEWIEDEYYIALQCDENDACSFNGEQVEYLPTNSMYRPYFPIPDYTGWLGDIDYEAHQWRFAMVIAPQVITIYDAANSVDLSEPLDGDIVDIEWLPSLFYYAP